MTSYKKRLENLEAARGGRRREAYAGIMRRQHCGGEWQDWHIVLSTGDGVLLKRYNRPVEVGYAATLDEARERLAAMADGYGEPLRVVFNEQTLAEEDAQWRWWNDGQPGGITAEPVGKVWGEWLLPGGKWKPEGWRRKAQGSAE